MTISLPPPGALVRRYKPFVVNTDERAVDLNSQWQFDIPLGVSVGQRAILVAHSETQGTLDTPAGWTSIRQVTWGSRQHAFFTKLLTGGDTPGSTVSVGISGEAAVRRTATVTSVIGNHGGNIDTSAVTQDTGDPATIPTNSRTGNPTWMAVVAAYTGNRDVTSYPNDYPFGRRESTIGTNGDSTAACAANYVMGTSYNAQGSFNLGGNANYNVMNILIW